jgi:hypothetical protein
MKNPPAAIRHREDSDSGGSQFDLQEMENGSSNYTLLNHGING